MFEAKTCEICVLIFSRKEAKTKRNGSRFFRMRNKEKKKEAKQAHYHCCLVPETFPAR
jgi:hypothetical protein